jgi:hypothetical protein
LYRDDLSAAELQTISANNINLGANRKWYAFQNYQTGMFIRRNGNCVYADSRTLNEDPRFVLVSGRLNYNIPNVIGIISLANNQWLGARSPGDDIDECGGEVGCGALNPSGQPVPPTPPYTNYIGFWIIAAAAKPQAASGNLGDFGSTLVAVGADILSFILG